MAKYNLIALEIICLVVLISGVVNALSMPLSIEGSIFDLDSGLPIHERVHISVNDTRSGFYVEGMTGTFFHPEKYSVSVDGQAGDDVIVTVWNDRYSSSLVVDLASSVYDANLYLNMTRIVVPNTPPHFVSSPITFAYSGQLYRYDSDAQDPDNEDALTYRLVEKPQGMTIDPDTGIILWIPSLWQIGRNNVRVAVDDGRNGTAEQNFSINVQWIWFTKSNIASLDLRNNSFIGDIYLVSLNDSLVYGINRSFVLQDFSVKNYSSNLLLAYSQGIEKPSGVKTAARKVYSYLQLFSLNLPAGDSLNSSFVVSVDNSWLDRKNVEANRLTLMQYRDKKWFPVDTSVLQSDNRFVYLIAKTDRLGNFAIVEGPRRVLNEEQEEFPFYVAGFVYQRDGRTQISRGTDIEIENVRTHEKLNFQTGIGPMDGAYAIVLPGERGETISISIAGSSRYLLVLEKNENNIDFVQKRFGNGFSADVHQNEEINNVILEFLRNLF